MRNRVVFASTVPELVEAVKYVTNRSGDIDQICLWVGRRTTSLTRQGSQRSCGQKVVSDGAGAVCHGSA